MPEVRTMGLTSIKFGDIANDGGMGQTLAVIALTEKDSAKITSTEPEIKEFYAEEESAPIEVIITKDPVLTLELSIHDIAPATLVKIFGGTATPAVAYAAGPPVVPSVPAYYTPPSATVDIEQSVEVTSLRGNKMKIVRGKVVASFDVSLGRQDLGRVKIKVTVLTPTKANTAAYTIHDPATVDPT